MPNTTFPSGDTCPQVQGTKKGFASFAPYFAMSASPSVTMNDGRKSYSTCATSGAPDPAFSAVCNFVYSAGPPPTLFTFALMLGKACSNSFTTLSNPPTQDQNSKVIWPSSTLNLL